MLKTRLAVSVAVLALAVWPMCAGAADRDTTDDHLGTVTARGENGTAEGMLRAFDNSAYTKWLDFSLTSWIQYAYASGQKYTVTKYTLTSANDHAERDPKDWKLLGSNDGGTTWTQVDAQTGQKFTSRYQKVTYTVAASGSYAAYRLQILAVADPATANSVHLAELELLADLPNRPPVFTSVTAEPNPATTGQLVYLFSAASDPDGDGLTYTYDYGDGTTGTSLSHRYSSPGTYLVQVTVSDGHGGTDSASTTLVVNAASTYSIAASAGSGGTITPYGSVSVPSGGSQTFTITPKAGYKIDRVVVDGTSVGAVTSYTFSNVTAMHQIYALFSTLTGPYTISAYAYTVGGTMTPSGSVTVNLGASQTFAITPNAGYKVDKVLVDDVSVGAVSTYTFSNVSGNHTIGAYFSVGSSNGPGDLNGDKTVNIEDLVLVVAHFGQSSSSPGWDARADANGDGVVNVQDLTVVISNFGKSYP